MSEYNQMFQHEDEKLFRFRKLELENIARNQWYLGEKWGRPVLWSESEWHWTWNFRKDWIAALKASGEYPFD